MGSEIIFRVLKYLKVYNVTDRVWTTTTAIIPRSFEADHSCYELCPRLGYLKRKMIQLLPDGACSLKGMPKLYTYLIMDMIFCWKECGVSIMSVRCLYHSSPFKFTEYFFGAK